MEKNLYIDASHPNETRVVLKSGENIEDYEYEGLKNNLIKNNIYLGKVSRIEPSLQAAFVDFGRERQRHEPPSCSVHCLGRHFNCNRRHLLLAEETQKKGT